MIDEQDQTASGRFASLGWRSVAIAGAAAATGIVALVALNDPAPQGARYTISEGTVAPVTLGDDPLRAELARCRTLPADTDDAGCRAAWEVNRRRFMGESRSFVAPAQAIPAIAPIAPTSNIQAGER